MDPLPSINRVFPGLVQQERRNTLSLPPVALVTQGSAANNKGVLFLIKLMQLRVMVEVVNDHCVHIVASMAIPLTGATRSMGIPLVTRVVVQLMSSSPSLPLLLVTSLLVMNM
ncbi:unnamed protein product [Linum trigynum]|uniref:Uncharacterized protein n=1 Tax=Linum trigynum TaxID=586398 RepID=A0AAV2DWP6_9ROSI